MPKAAEALWADCVKVITSLVNTPPTAQAFSAIADKMEAAMKAMDALPPCKTAEWEAILLKHKVPYHLAAACAKGAQRPRGQYYMATTFSTTHLLFNFMSQTNRSSVLSTPSSTSRKLYSAIWQQLQQSGLLDVLPGLVTAVAVELDKTTSEMSSDRPQQSRLPQGRASDAAANYPASKVVSSLLAVIGWLSQLKLESSSSSSSSSDRLSLDVAHMHLVYALARDVSRQLVRSGPDPEQLFALARAFGFLQLASADSLIELLTSAAARNGTEPALKQVMLSPVVLPCLTLMLATVAYRPAAEQQRKATARAAKSSSSNGGSSSSGGGGGIKSSSGSCRQADPLTKGDSISPAAAALAWQAANHSAALLPASHQQLCTLLGVDVRLLLTLANLDTMFTPKRANSKFADIELCDGMLTVYQKLMFLWGLDAVLHLWEQKTAEQQQLELELQLLLPTVLLHCAGKIPPSSPVHGKYCLIAAMESRDATYAWSRLSRHKAVEPGGRQGLRSGQQQQQEQEPVQLTADWVAEVLPAALKLARRVLPQLQEDADILNAAEQNAEGIGSSSRSTDGVAGSSKPSGQGRSAASAAAGTGADTALHFSTSSHRGECLHAVLRLFVNICDNVLPPTVAGPRASSSDRMAAILAHFNIDKDDPVAEKVNAFWGRSGATSSSQSDAAVGNSSSQGQEGSSSEGAATAGSDTPSQPLAASGSVSAVAGSVVPMLRVLEAFMRTAAGAPAMPLSWVENSEPGPASETPLQLLLGFTMVPTADAPSLIRNTEWDYEPAAPALLQLAVSAGPGSAAQHALYSLLFSVVKLSLLQSSKAPGILQDPDRCVLLVVDAATHLLRVTAATASDTAASATASPAGTASASPTAAPTSTEGLTVGSSSTRSAEPPQNAASAQQAIGQSRASVSASAVQLLPSIAIFGRLCLLYGQQLPAKIPMMVQMKELKTEKGLREDDPSQAHAAHSLVAERGPTQWCHRCSVEGGTWWCWAADKV